MCRYRQGQDRDEVHKEKDRSDANTYHPNRAALDDGPVVIRLDLCRDRGYIK